MFREVFIPKATAETAATAVSALCFFSLPKDGVWGKSKFMPMYYT